MATRKLAVRPGEGICTSKAATRRAAAVRGRSPLSRWGILDLTALRSMRVMLTLRVVTLGQRVDLGAVIGLQRFNGENQNRCLANRCRRRQPIPRFRSTQAGESDEVMSGGRGPPAFWQCCRWTVYAVFQLNIRFLHTPDEST